MPEGVGYGPQNTASAGKDLIIIGNHAYAYSGIQTIASPPNFQTLLEFTTGNYLFVGNISWCGSSANSWDFFTNIYLNGVLIWNATYEDGKYAMSDQPLPLVIPPYTHVVAQLSSAGADNVAMTMAGKIFK